VAAAAGTQIEQVAASGKFFLKNRGTPLPHFRFPQAFHAIKILPLDLPPISLFRSIPKRPLVVILRSVLQEKHLRRFPADLPGRPPPMVRNN